MKLQIIDLIPNLSNYKKFKKSIVQTFYSVNVISNYMLENEI